jgi:WD40 repeat protein
MNVLINGKLKVFISYARKDREFADRLVTALEARGIEVLIDRRDLPLLEKFQGELLGFIHESDAAVFIVSEAAIASPWCGWEVDRITELKKRLAPVMIEAIAPERLPKALEEINLLFFTEPDDFDAQADRLAAALGTNIGWVKDHTRLGNLALRWSDRAESPVLLLRGDELGEAERWLLAKPRVAPEPADLHRAYITASRLAENRRRRVQVSLAGTAAVISAALAGLAFWFQQDAVAQRDIAVRNEGQAITAREAETRQRAVAEENEKRAVGALRDAQHNISLFRAERAEILFRENQKTTAMLLALESLPDANSKTPERRDWPVTTQAQAILDKTMREGQEQRTLFGHSSMVYDVRFSPDGERLLSSSFDGIKLWNVRTGDLIADLPGTGLQSIAAFSPDGRVILTGREEVEGGQNEGGLLWDGVTGKPKGSLLNSGQYPGAFNHAAEQGVHFNRKGTFAVYGSSSRIDILSGDLWTGNLKLVNSNRIRGNSDMFSGRLIIAVDDNGKFALTSYGAKMRIWSLEDGRLIREVDYKSPIESLAIDSARNRFIAVTRDGGIHVVSSGRGDQSFRLARNKITDQLGVVSHAKINPAGTRLLVAVDKDWFRLFDLDKGADIRSLEPSGAAYSAFSADGKLVATASSEQAIVWDAATGEQLFTFGSRSAGLNSVGFNAAGTLLATGSSSGEINIWSLARKSDASTKDVKAGDCRYAMWVEDKPNSTKTTDMNDNVETSEGFSELAERLGREEPYIKKNSRGSYRYTGPEGHYKLFAINVPAGLIATKGGMRRKGVEWMETIFLWNVRSGTLYGKIEDAHQGRIHGFDFSPDGKLLMSYGDEKVAKIWDVKTLRQVGSLPGHDDTVFGGCFSHHGDRAVTLTQKAVKVWDVASKQLLQDLPTSMEPWYVTFSDDDQSVIVSADKSDPEQLGEYAVQTLEVLHDLQALIERAKTQAPSCLTQQQREQLLLAPEPPDWCLAMRKPPYNAAEWRSSQGDAQ